MLTSKVFVKKTKRGSVVKIVREHYLRDDITCGSQRCTKCDHGDNKQPLEAEPVSESSLCTSPHYLLPDTNVVLHQIDVLEDPAIKNVIVLQTVLDEVKHRNIPAYKRLKENMLGNSEKHFFTFTNEYNRETYVERVEGESANDRNDRAVRTAVKWYEKHLPPGVKVVLITNDNENRRKAIEEGITAYTIEDYVKSMKASAGLVDRLAITRPGEEAGSGKNLYPEHLPLTEIQRGLKSGRFLQGTFHASRENREEGFVNVQDLEKSMFLASRMHQNRSVEGDIVAVEMLPESEWSCPSSVIKLDEDVKDAEDDEDLGTEDSPSKRNRVPKELRQPTGKVVGVIQRKWRQYCGILQRSDMRGSNRHLFKPSDRKVPWIRIETRQAEQLQDQHIVVAIDSWPRNSKYPMGHFVRRLGSVGDKDTENEVLLLEHDVPHSNFSEAVLSFLPRMPWLITEEDRKKRRDLRHISICSVDPPGCTDIDDALHARHLENGNYEVGVHIADVSHFIRPGNALDKEAASRGTTVYLCDQRIDMVPDLLSSNLCSLRSNVERFAFTVLWEVNEKAEIQNVSFCKSIINSRASLTYAEAQMRIDDPSMQDEITTSLRLLNKLAKVLKRKRIENGALSLSSPEVRFQVDSETHDPIDVQAKELRDTNSMVEEFMLLANISVAEKITQEFPNCALLRRHPAPPPSNFDPVIRTAASKGFEMAVSTGKELAESLDKAVFLENPYFNTMLRIMTTRCMMQAVYFCSGMLPEADYAHYGLATPIYTHFTSPIRRYSDIIAHRLLAVCINADTSYPELLDKHKTQALCNNLNYRHKMAQYAGRASVNLHTHLFFKARVQDEEGYVLFVRKNALQVLIPKYGLEGTLFLTGNDISVPFVFNEEESTQSCGDVVFHVFDRVVVQISIDQSNVQHMKLVMKLVEPKIEGFSVPPVSSGKRPASQSSSPAPAAKKAKTSS